MNNSKSSLDTNILLRLLLNDIPAQHQAAIRLFKQSTSTLQIADAALIEIVYVLTKNYGYTRSQVVEILNGLLSLPKINCHRKLFVKVLPLYLEKGSLSFTDCCLAIYAELCDAEPLWTFDQKLARQVKSAKLVPVA